MLTKPSLSPKSKEEELLYVRVRSPVDVRRELLLSSKGVLSVLKRLEHVRDLRKQKERVQADVHHVFEQLIVLNRRLRAVMPKTSIHVPPVEVLMPKKKEVQLPQAEVAPPVPKEKTKLELLEEELSSIESKLAALE